MFKEKYFKLAFELAERGRGKCSPNPFVGAVIVKDDQIIGQGFTQPYGNDHAEVQAIKEAGNCKDAEMYVTLEPCAHFGKTPPCADAIIKAGIKKIYAGIRDPNPLVNGKGFQKLMEAGIEVQTGFLKDRIEKQLEYYLTYITKKRPFVIMKNAVSLDGKIATESGDAKWISCPESREYVHHLRNEIDVILTGIGTVLNDDPLLNVRLEKPSERFLPEEFSQLTFGTVDDKSKENDTTIAEDSFLDHPQGLNHPTRVILDSNLKIPVNSKIVQTAEDIKTIIFIRQDIQDEQDKIVELQKRDVEIRKVVSDKNGLNLTAILQELYEQNYYSVMVEAGSRVCSSFLRESLVDKIFYFISPKIVGGNFSLFREIKIPKMDAAAKLKIDRVGNIGNDFLIVGYF